MVESPSGALPRGRHNLTREQVAKVQRDRMLVGVAEAMAVKGYVGTSVTDIIKRAGVSRETFYQQFSSKQDCFVAALTVAGDLLLTLFEAIAEAPGTSGEHLDAVIEAYLDGIIENEAFARLYLVEVYAAGPEAMALRSEFQHRVTERITAMLGIDDEERRFACELIVAGLGSIVTMPLVTGDQERLRSLREPLVDLVQDFLLP